MAEQPSHRFYWPENAIDCPEPTCSLTCVMRHAWRHTLQKFQLELPFCLLLILCAKAQGLVHMRIFTRKDWFHLQHSVETKQ